MPNPNDTPEAIPAPSVETAQNIASQISTESATPVTTTNFQRLQEPEDETFSCDCCSESRALDDRHIVQNGDSVCIECIEENYCLCESCEDYVPTDDTRGAYNRRGRRMTICDSCFSDDYFVCQDCDETFHVDNWHDGEYCASCYEENHSEEHSEHIHSYSRRINAPFLGIGTNGSFEEIITDRRKTLFLGVELEVESQNLVNDAETCVNLFPQYNYNPLTILKKDGSLTAGFEIVSCPATLDAHRKLWQKFFAERQKVTSLKSHDTKTCGLHVHVSRAPLSQMQIAKVVLFCNSAQNTAFIEALARRSASNYARIKPKKVRDIFNREDGILSNPDRYEAVNLQNDATIEFRLFRGTLKPDTFFRTLEFCEALILFCAPAETGLTDALHWEKFSAWLTADFDRTARYSKLVAWLANYTTETKPE